MNEIMKVQKSLESIKKVKNDFEYWSARDLMEVLGYSGWRNFEIIIKKARIACKESNHDVMGHFVDANKKIITGKTAQMRIKDYLLTRIKSKGFCFGNDRP